jgi:ribonuclease HII
MKLKVGIDEVGRGPIAGPVTVGVVCVPPHFSWKHVKGLKDSKQLTEKQREQWYAWVKHRADIRWAVASVSAKEIDRIGIAEAARVAARRALKSLNLNQGVVNIRLDQGLSVGLEWKQEQFIKGDERFSEIALASVMAKVTRDKYMVRMSKKYPAYGFEKHKGYGTAAHRLALSNSGLSGMHRKSFCERIDTW